ncbi:hypothetical protein [Flavobacterium sp. ACN6]|uniref:hypothetical protein n=1 Tax=Flavobacterium sp. ACN6 TaxID=1920426 RepID=UPI000BB35C9F|nr:hypothetical protein [Flavobacterium sp. ACN6]PBJ15839.1 hypothetical protein BSF42_02430 [Flavobacterium sp. ACN6]
MEIPNTVGEGDVRKVGFGSAFKLTIHRYTLEEDLIIKRNPSPETSTVRTFFFYNTKQDLEVKYENEENIPFSQKNDASILLSTNDLRTEIRFPANNSIQYVVVAIAADRLRAILSIENPNSTIKTITAENASFLFFESLDTEMQLLLKNIVSFDIMQSKPVLMVSNCMQRLGICQTSFYLKVQTCELMNMAGV